MDIFFGLYKLAQREVAEAISLIENLVLIGWKIDYSVVKISEFSETNPLEK
tara:strand:+ start:254048 stop:254200 length:153 start_codon:yes stop_codon:yes gene_type:complete